MKLLHIFLCGLSFATANSSVFKFCSPDLKTKLGITENVEAFFQSQKKIKQTGVVVLDTGPGASSEIVFKRAHVAEPKKLRSSHVRPGDFANFETRTHGTAVINCITQIEPEVPIFAFNDNTQDNFSKKFLSLQEEDRMNIGANASLGGQKVINMSFGYKIDSYPTDSYHSARLMFETIKPLVQAGNIVVWSLENQAVDLSLNNTFVSYFNTVLKYLTEAEQERVFLVGGSLNPAEKNTCFSHFSQLPQEGYDNYIHKRVFYAPSSKVCTRNEKGYFQEFSGTSLSAAFVSGTIAKFLSFGYSLHQVNEIMTSETNILNFETMVAKAKSLDEKKEELDYAVRPDLKSFLNMIKASQKVEEVEMHIHDVIKNKEREIEKILDSDPMITHSQIFHLALDIYNQDFLPFVLPYSLFWGKQEHEKRSYWRNKEDLKAILFIQKEIHKKCSDLLWEKEVNRLNALIFWLQNCWDQETHEDLLEEDEHKDGFHY